MSEIITPRDVQSKRINIAQKARDIDFRSPQLKPKSPTFDQKVPVDLPMTEEDHHLQALGLFRKAFIDNYRQDGGTIWMSVSDTVGEKLGGDRTEYISQRRYWLTRSENGQVDIDYWGSSTHRPRKERRIELSVSILPDGEVKIYDNGETRMAAQRENPLLRRIRRREMSNSKIANREKDYEGWNLEALANITDLLNRLVTLSHNKFA